MKLTNLFKKLLTAAMAVALLGMLAGCANGSGGSSGGGNGSNSAPEYSIMYDDILLFGTNSNGYHLVKSQVTDGNYTESGKILTVNDDGFDEIINTPIMSKNLNKTYVAIVSYQKRWIKSVTTEDIKTASSVLESGTDYEFTHNDRVIELTASGYVKGASLFASR